MFKYFIFLVLFLWSMQCAAQLNPKDSVLFTPIIETSFSVNFPGGDLVNRFGINGAIGGGIKVKTKTNLILGLKYDYFFGRDVKEWQILNNLQTQSGFIINPDGLPSETDLFERGYALFGIIGKVSPSFGEIKLGPNKNSGLIYWVGFGMLQHKIRIKSDVPQLQNEYSKGYDRLSNGIAVTEFLGYLHLGNTRLINFYFGIDACQAWTKNRRGFNFDTMKAEDELRFDLLTGFKFGWILPLYKKMPNEFYYN